MKNKLNIEKVRIEELMELLSFVKAQGFDFVDLIGIPGETGIIYERGAKGASEVLNIPVSQITKSLKTKQTVNGNTFIYS